MLTSLPFEARVEIEASLTSEGQRYIIVGNYFSSSIAVRSHRNFADNHHSFTVADTVANSY